MIELLTLSTMEEFERIRGLELSLIAFGTPWSSPCQNQYKILLKFMKKYRGIMTISRVDVEKFPEIARKSNIQTVPTLIVYRKKLELKRLIGLQSLQSLHDASRGWKFLLYVKIQQVKQIPGYSMCLIVKEIWKMPTCVNHPDRETSYICLKHNVYLCEECLACSDPELYCKFRSSCIIWFMTRKITRTENRFKKVLRN